MFKKIFDKIAKKQSGRTYKERLCMSFIKDMTSFRDYGQAAEEAYIKNVIANRAISIVAVTASSVPINLFKLIDGKKKQRLQSHRLVNLLNQPNTSMSRMILLKNLIMYKLISGNGYILRIGDKVPKELHLLRPDRVSVIPGEDCMPAGYIYQVGQKKREYLVNRLTGDCQVLHIKDFHPTDDWYGLSQAEAATYSIEQHNQASIWNHAMLKNGARPRAHLCLGAMKI